MADVTATSWFPVVTLISGYALKSITDFVQHKWNVEKEREAREAKQQDQRFERRTTFQRETLLALQDVCMDLARATGRTNHLDYMENKTEKTWHKTKLPEDLDEGYRLAQARMLMLAVRVRDDTIRDLVRDFKSCSTAVVTAKNVSEADQGMARMASVHTTLNERIGEVLREIDNDE